MLRSTAKTAPSIAFRASSNVTAPVPAPTSHTVSPGCTPRRATDTHRTSSLVIGTFARVSISSRTGSNGFTEFGLRTSITARSAQGISASSDAVPFNTLSPGEPRFTPMYTCTPPSPASASERQTNCTLLSPPVSANVFSW